MAKGKHSTALFEVIHSAKRPQAVAQTLRTPKWWFKGRPAGSTTPSGPPSFNEPEPPVSVAAPPARQPRSHAEPSDNARSTVHMAFDPHRKEITFRLRYTTALVSAFALCVIVGMSYVVGRHLGGGPRAASGAQPTIDQLRSEPPQPGVADVPARQPRPSVASASRRASEAAPKAHAAPAQPLVQAPTQTPTIDDGPRSIGLNYVIISGYPPQELKTAAEARDFLARKGIPCTLEHVPQWGNRWICLVSKAGFARVTSPEYEAYVQRILAVAEKFPTSHFDKFNPLPCKWRGDEKPAE